MELLFECIMHRVSIHLRVFTSITLNTRQQVDIRICEILQKKQSKLVLASAELHQEELMADWYFVMNSEEPFKIQPLQ